MNVLIIEDNKSSSENLIASLKKIKQSITVRGICTTAAEAIKAIKIFTPDLIFLDIELDDNSSGFEVLDAFKEFDFKVIFTTSHKEYAIRVFEYNAIHFLLKPFSDDNLRIAMERAEIITLGEQRQKIEELIAINSFLEKHTDHFTIKGHNGDMPVVNYKDIVYLEADGSYVNIYCIASTEKFICTSKSLTDFENILKFKEFTRISQKHLLNVSYIKKYIKPNKNKSSLGIIERTEDGGGGYIELSIKKTLPVSRRYLNELKESLHII